MLSITSLFLCSLFILQISADTQSIGVRGTLMCGGAPLTNAKVKLYDDDTGIDLDDLMAEGATDGNGNFFLQGSESEIMTIDPKLNIYHDCDDGIAPCQRRVTIFLPKSYVDTGNIPKRVFELGTLNMEAVYDGETRDCLNRRK